MTTEQKVQVFKKELSYIESPLVKTFTEDMLADVPKYFFVVPASSTGKYHPDYALGEGGLVRHTKAAALIGNILRTINPCRLEPLDLDCAIAAIILHDTRKCGMTDELNLPHSRFDHPKLAAYAVRNNFETIDKCCPYDSIGFTREECLDIHERIASMIESHMGQWNTSKYSPGITLNVPASPSQFFVHMCDYLASRKEIDIKNLF